MRPAILRTFQLACMLVPGSASALPIPMEPAERTLFVFVHGINPRSAGAIEKDMENESGFCVDNKDLLGRASFVWLRDLDDKKSDKSLFCNLHRNLFGQQYSLRAFSDPGQTPIFLAQELGDRQWKDTTAGLLRSHVVEAMARYLQSRLDSANAKKSRGASRSMFEDSLISSYPDKNVTNLAKIFGIMSDSVPSRVVVLAHSMGGLTTREYLASEYFNGDLDKVVTYDSPHGGSWVAKYNQEGLYTVLNVFKNDGIKVGIGCALMALNTEASDAAGMFFLVSGLGSIIGGTATQISGYFGNKFLGTEEANWYLPPNSSNLVKLNNRSEMPCEAKGCRIPSFQLHGVDGVLAPDNPGKFVGNEGFRMAMPVEMADAAMAFGMAHGRNWPTSISEDKRIGLSMTAGSFAYGGWNYSQHGSLVVPLNSSRADGIPFLSRSDVRKGMREIDWGRDAAPLMKSDKKELDAWTGMGIHVATLGTLSALAYAIPWEKEPIIIAKIALGIGVGASATIDMGTYALATSPSHNSTLWLNATKQMTDTVHRDDSAKQVLRFTEAEYDLYEAPYAQIASTGGRDDDGDSILILRLKTGRDDSVPYRIAIKQSQLQEIDYRTAGWENRWAVREERQVPVQDSSTRVRQVTRRNLPVEILTTSQISEMDLQIDDLRPDLMEQMEITLNWGMFRFVWDRDHDTQGNPLGTFKVRVHYSDGQVPRMDTSTVTNPIDAYGRWNVPLKQLVPSHLQVLMDGQNLISISLLNHVGKFSAQSQYITFQATPPVVAMTFPRPYQTISNASAAARFEANLLYYGGISFDTASAAWSLTPSGTPILVSDERRIPGLLGNDSVQDFALPMSQVLATGADGKWNLGLRIQTVQDASKQNGSDAIRKFPFWLDRTAPTFHPTAEGHYAGEPWRFRIVWNDLPEGLSDVVELVRFRIRDTTGKVVAELPPFEFVSGGSRLVQWDGRTSSGPVQDGRYTLVIEGKDGAVPSDTAEAMILSLRRELRELADTTTMVWTPRRDTMWNALRRLPLMNWGIDSVSFHVDRTPPKVVATALKNTLIGSDSVLVLPLSVSDLGSSARNQSVTLRLNFLDSIAKRSFTTGMDVRMVSGDSSRPTQVAFTEGEDVSGRLPDGTWTVTIIASDADGNADTIAIPERVRIDRASPVFTFASPSPSYISSAATTISGEVGLDVKGAASVTAVWKTPSGTSYPATLTNVGDGLWKVTYPQAMKNAKGSWILEVTATDSAGNTTRTSTFVQVDLMPPRLEVPATIQGSIVLKGLAMDPQIDTNSFVSYELSWRESGETVWRHDGMRVPRGRGPDSLPWMSVLEQSAVGVLGFWDPPSSVNGSVELRVSVDDGSGESHEAIQESYVTSFDSAEFLVNPSTSTDSLVAGVGAKIGFDIVSTGKDRTYDAQATLVDGRSSPLWVSWPQGLKTSSVEGRPNSFSTGSMHLWREKEAWHLRTLGACRAFRVIIQTWSSDSIPVKCPKGWSCRQDSLPDASYSIAGDSFQVNRLLEWTIPSGSTDSMVWKLDRPGRVSFSPQGTGTTCAATTGCTDTALSPLFPAPGELRLGSESRPLCSGAGLVELNPGQGSYSADWDGFRQNGNWPDGTKATLEVDVWDATSMRVVHARLPVALKSGTLRLGAKVSSGVVMAANAPNFQKRAALELTVEGRGAAVNTRILQGDVVVRSLPGSGTWREGRPLSLPYRLDWDGTNDKGAQVPQGTYTFQVDAEGVKATAEVKVGGGVWTRDSSLKLAIAPGEAEWSAGLNAWKLAPPPLLNVSTGVVGKKAGGTIQYGVEYEGLQSVLAFRTQRPSLMIRRKRDRVKYGLLFKVSTFQQGYDSKKQFGTDCGDRDPGVYVENYEDGGVVDIGRGEIVSREVTVHAQADLNETTFRILAGKLEYQSEVYSPMSQKVEYVAVPLEIYKNVRGNNISEGEWKYANANSFTYGSFSTESNLVNPIYGTGDSAKAFVSSFAPSPLAPRQCDSSKLEDPDGDGILSHEEWANGACKEPLTDNNTVSPNRNLIWFGVRPIRSPVEKIASSIQFAEMPYVWNYETDGPECAGNRARSFSFTFSIKTPDEFFDAKPGVDNLANRLLRFDAANKFLYGSDAFLPKDGFDNDGNGLVDDPSDAIGPMSPFETRTYNWRPIWTDPSASAHGCTRTDTTTTNVSLTDGEWRWDEPTGQGWMPVGEFIACGVNSNQRCQSWVRYTAAPCSTVAVSNIIQDKLNFHEGDHSLRPDSLIAWFTNTPEQGTARYIATIRQGGRALYVDSKTHSTPETAFHASLDRGFSSGTANPVLMSRPVQFTVGMRSDIGDFLSTSGDAVQIPWPLDSAKWTRLKDSSDARCLAADPADPSACRRIFAAASGIRFGLNDGLEPDKDAKTVTSQAQIDFFKSMARNAGANPNGLPDGRIPTGTSTLDFHGSLQSDTLGRSVHVDSLNFRAPWDSRLGGIHTINRATPIAPGFEIAGPDSTGRVRFTGESSEEWSLGMDARMGGRERLRSDIRWQPGALDQVVRLDSLYRASAWPRQGAETELSLFLEDSTGVLASNEDRLSDIGLTSQEVHWRNGTDASSMFSVEPLSRNLSGYPEGLRLRRNSLVRSLPEWIAIRGGVSAGTPYWIGWADSAGGWRPLGEQLVSTCPTESSIRGICNLGLVDASILPSRGRILIQAGSPGAYRFDEIPFARGTTLAATTSGRVSSLFGDAQVIFPSGSLVGKSEAERTVSVRVLSSTETGLGSRSGITVIGPVVEILPSQAFTGTTLPEIVLRLARSSFREGGVETDPSTVQLYKVDALTGVVVPLSDQTRQRYCDGVACTGSDWTEIEFHGRTSSFSQFALLPADVPDSRLWTFSVSPMASADLVRKVVLDGIDPTDVEVLWVSRPNEDVYGESQPMMPAEITWSGKTGLLRIPGDSVAWLSVRRKDRGGLARLFRIEVLRETFAFHSKAEDTVFAGRTGTIVSLPYESNHKGALRLVARSGAKDVAWADTQLESGLGRWEFALPSDWESVPDVTSTRLIATDVGGSVIEVQGPVLLFDRARPTAHLVVTTHRGKGMWRLHIVPTGSDDHGIASASLSVSLNDGTILGEWSGLEARDVILSDSALDSRASLDIRVVLGVQDRSGNRSDASWSGTLTTPEQSSLLWLVPTGSPQYGWSVEDRGRHRLATWIDGFSSLRGDALAFDEPSTRVFTEAVSDSGVLDATVELLGVWDSASTLLERVGSWTLQREGSDVLLSNGAQTLRWPSAFASKLHWMHLALVIQVTKVVLYRDGVPLGEKTLEVPLDWNSPRPWSLGGGGHGARLGLVRVWNESFDSAQVEGLRKDALGIDSVLWIEGESMEGSLGHIAPHCDLPSRFAFAPGDSTRSIQVMVGGPRTVHVGGRWMTSANAQVVVTIDGTTIDTFDLPPRQAWGSLDSWTARSGRSILAIPNGQHRIAFHVSAGVHLDGVALVSGDGRLDRWEPPTTIAAEPIVEVLVRDDSPTEKNYWKPRIIVKNLSNQAIPGYRLQVRMRTDASRPPVVETWWPTPLASSLAHDGHGLFTWTLDRSEISIQPGLSDFGSSGVALGFHHDDWSEWSRWDDPSWDTTWANGNWTVGTGIPVFSTDGQLLSRWECRDEGYRAFPSTPPVAVVPLSGSAPIVLEGKQAQVVVAPEGSWNWSSTVVGITPLDGLPLSGTLVSGGTTWLLSGWWQQIILPNATHTQLKLNLDLGTSRKVQLQKWQQ